MLNQRPVLEISKSTATMNIFLAIALVFGTAAAAPSANYGHITAIDSYSIPRYEFNYAVNDPVTGDNKAQSEAREGGVVKGSYSLAESDGTLRVVEYTADDIHGFNAKVKRIGAAAHPQQLFTPVVKQIVQPIAAPVYEPIAEPIYRPIAPPGAVAHPQQLFTPAVNKVVQPIAAPVYEPIAEPIYRPIAPPIYKNLAPVSFSYSISNLNNLGGYGGYEKNLDLGLDLGFGGWNMGRLGLDHGGWIH